MRETEVTLCLLGGQSSSFIVKAPLPPYVYLDVMKRTWAGEMDVSLLIAKAVKGGGYREILGIVESAKEDKAGWSSFLMLETQNMQ